MKGNEMVALIMMMKIYKLKKKGDQDDRTT